MRLARYAGPGQAIAAAVVGEPGDVRLHALRDGVTVEGLAAAGLDATAAAVEWALAHSTAVPLDRVRLLAPLVPPTVRDFVAFEEHIEGVVRSVSGDSGIDAQWYAAPTFYFSNPHSLVGAHEDVAPPAGCDLLDFELEVAAVVGAPGRDVDPRRAREHIFGYTILNDWSARDVQGREMKVGLGPAKGKDFATTLGPWVVTADELEPYRDAEGFLALEMEAFVDGRRVGHDLLSHAAWTFEEMLAYASRDSWVRPGDVLGSGTCGNGGCLAELWGRSGELVPPPLAPRNIVRLDVQGIGSLENRIVERAPAPAGHGTIPRARARHVVRRSADERSPQGAACAVRGVDQ